MKAALAVAQSRSNPGVALAPPAIARGTLVRSGSLGPLVAAWLLFCASCSLVTPDYRVDTTRLDNGSCKLGDHQCSGDWLLSCNGTLDGWVRAAACDSAELCDSRGGRCAACRAGEYRCTGAKLEVCRADGSSWSFVDDCGDAGKCNINLQACAKCTPAEFQCNQGELSRCASDGTWGPPTACGAPELCVVSDDRKTGQCEPSAKCDAQTYSCQDERLVRCDAQGAALQPIETCATAGLCQKTLALAVSAQSLTCVRPACDANTVRCDGNQLLVCAMDRSGFSPELACTADNPCNASTGACGKCTPGAVICQGAELTRCSTTGAFDKVADCASAALCNAVTAQCEPAQCTTPGQSECDEAVPFLHTCGADLKWHDTVCDTTALCNAVDGRCEASACERGAQRCDHGRFQRCNASQTGWDTVLECASGSECDPVTGTCATTPCQAGAHRCNDVFLEDCTSQGTWQRVSRCATHGLCNATTGMCTAPECTIGTFRCTSEVDLESCGPERTWKPFTTCVGKKCDDLDGKCI